TRATALRLLWLLLLLLLLLLLGLRVWLRGLGLGRHFGGFSFLHHLKLQSAFAGSVGEGLHPAMEQKAATVEHDRGDARLLRAIGNCLANGGSAVLGGVRLALEA